MPCGPASRTLLIWCLADLREVSQIQIFSLDRHQEENKPQAVYLDTLALHTVVVDQIIQQGYLVYGQHLGQCGEIGLEYGQQQSYLGYYCVIE